MKIIYVSSCIFRDTKNEKFIDYAASHVSELFLRGINKAETIDCEVVNIEPITPWPKNKKISVKEEVCNIEGKSVLNIGFINTFLVKQVSLRNSLAKALKNRVCKGDWILIYGLTTPRLIAASKCAKLLGCKVAFIVPDLPNPQYMNPGGGELYKTLKNLDVSIQRKYYKYVDKWILFSEKMSDFFKIDITDCIVIEGMTDDIHEDQEEKGKDKDDFIVAYTGSVAFAYGLKELVDSVHKLDESIKLNIAGTGDAVDYVKKISETDDRIQYVGALPHSEIYEFQRKASVLVNPRGNLEFTKYSFPSKTLEYMLAGIPVLMQHLDGIPKEYDGYLNYYSKEKLGEEILEIYNNYDKYIDKAEKARLFVKEKKNYIYQTNKLITFLKG
ncbi:MAG: glycosyltransferase [Lachnospiraceae bacterium]|nr:glycosyltransferase [Lachnospiraceae bacterium]